MIRAMLFTSPSNRKFLGSLLLLGVLTLTALPLRADSVVTDPVGFVNTTIQGTNGTSSSALTLVGLSVTQPVSFQGSVGSYNSSSKTLTPSNGTFTADQFNGPNGAFFVEITSGAGAGTFSDITATAGSPSSITTADDLSAIATAGSTFKIRQHWTLQSVFGPNSNTANQVLLGTGATASSADEVLVYDRTTAQYITYYYKVGGVFGGDGWRSTTGGDPQSTDVSATVLRVSDGTIVRRKLSAAVTLSLPGAVKLGPTQRAVLSGINLFGDLYASGTTLANSGLYDPAHPETSLQSGATPATADQVLLYDGAQYVTYYYKVGGVFGGDGWRSTSGGNPLVTDVSNTSLPAGNCVIIRRIASLAFVWTAPQPFVIAP